MVQQMALYLNRRDERLRPRSEIFVLVHEESTVEKWKLDPISSRITSSSRLSFASRAAAWFAEMRARRSVSTRPTKTEPTRPSQKNELRSLAPSAPSRILPSPHGLGKLDTPGIDHRSRALLGHLVCVRDMS